MDYFCYISRSKIDQLFDRISRGEADEWSKTSTTENALDVDAHANFSIARVIDLFKGGITYGRKGILQIDQRIKRDYVEKLESVLLEITKQEPIRNITELAYITECRSIYYNYCGNFKVTTPIDSSISSDSILNIESYSCGITISLDCSLRYFSEGNEPDGTYHVHSSNARFLSGELELSLDTVFLYLNKTDGHVIGSPLFLKMNNGSIPL